MGARMDAPWDDLADAIEAGDAEAADVARDRMALLGMALFGMAAERCGPGMRDRLNRLGVADEVWEEIQAVAGPAQEYAERTGRWAAVEIRRLRAENWELALELARLKLRIELLEGAGNVVNAAQPEDAHQPGGGGGQGAGGEAA